MVKGDTKFLTTDHPMITSESETAVAQVMFPDVVEQILENYPAGKRPPGRER